VLYVGFVFCYFDFLIWMLCVFGEVEEEFELFWE